MKLIVFTTFPYCLDYILVCKMKPSICFPTKRLTFKIKLDKKPNIHSLRKFRRIDDSFHRYTTKYGREEFITGSLENVNS